MQCLCSVVQKLRRPQLVGVFIVGFAILHCYLFAFYMFPCHYNKVITRVYTVYLTVWLSHDLLLFFYVLC